MHETLKRRRRRPTPGIEMQYWAIILWRGALNGEKLVWRAADAFLARPTLQEAAHYFGGNKKPSRAGKEGWEAFRAMPPRLMAGLSSA